jgi:hypothetical protein
MINKINEFDVEVLNLFNEKADQIKNSSYIKYVLEKKPETTISKNQGETLKTKTIEPNDESLKSLVLTLRLFLQKSNQISFQKISKIYEELPNNFQKEKKLFSQAMGKINDILNTLINIKFDNKILTYREVFNTFIYGDLAHVDIDKRNTYKDWQSREGGLFALLKIDFHSIAINLIQCILNMQKLNEDVIKKIYLK